MSKRSKKARKHKQKHKEKKSFQPSAQAGAAEFLRAFKSAWNAGSWAEALSCYRSWTLRSGKQRQARLEAELLFRCASDFYRQGKVRVALEHLEEASTRDPERARRYPYYTGICLARLGELPQAQNRFSLAGDEFHRELLSSGGSPAAAFPEAVPGDPVFERGLLLRFWRRLLSEQEPESPSTALSRIHRAYRLLCASGDPTPQLKLLEGKPGFQVLALHLRLLAAVAERSTVKVRNLVKTNASLFALVGPAGEELQALLDIHLMLLLKEQNASEVIVLVELFSEADLKIAAPPLVLNEARFRLSLAETERGNLEAALELLEKVDATTPAILHNRALLLQRLGCYSQANEYWARLLKGEKKPKRSDLEDVRRAYATTLRFIAGNARYEGKLQEAFSCLNEACALDEGDRQALEPLQQVASELGRAREACDYARRLYELDPDNEEYLYTYLDELMSLPDPQGAARLYREALKKYPDNPSYSSGLAQCYLQQAWSLRSADQAEAARLAGEARRLDRSHAQLKYLEGLWLQREGKKEAAEKKFVQALKAVDSHSAEITLGFAFYTDGMPDRAFELFQSICSCSCPTSDVLAGQILIFLLEQGNSKLAGRICELMLEEKDFSLYSIADLLRQQGHPEFAEQYSLQLIDRDGADEEDKFLHLMVLNELSDRGRTLDYARVLREQARLWEDMMDVDFYNSLIKQIKSRGRFKSYHEQG